MSCLRRASQHAQHMRALRPRKMGKRFRWHARGLDCFCSHLSPLTSRISGLGRRLADSSRVRALFTDARRGSSRRHGGVGQGAFSRVACCRGDDVPLAVSHGGWLFAILYPFAWATHLPLEILWYVLVSSRSSLVLSISALCCSVFF